MTLQHEIYDIATRNLRHYDAKERTYHSEWYARSVF